MSRGAEERAAAVRRIEQALAGLRYGTIEIVVHDSKIAYIERRERFRIAAPEDSPGKGPATARAEPTLPRSTTDHAHPTGAAEGERERGGSRWKDESWRRRS